MFVFLLTAAFVQKRQNLEVNCFYIVHNFISIVAVVAVSQGGKG